MQIKLNKPLTDLNHLLMRNNLQPTPKRSSLINQYPAKNHKENQLNVSNVSRSPARSASRKNIQSKEDSLHSISQNEGRNRAKSRRIEFDHIKTCQNHEDRQGGFHINIEGQDLYYCEKCASKLKNQGFPIHKVHQENTSSQQNHASHQRNTLLLAYSHYEGYPQFEVLKDLLSKIYESQHKMLNIRPVDQFITQLQTSIDQFYDKIEEMVKSKRQSNKAQLQLIKQKWDSEELVQAFDEIKMMKKDIQQNVQSIIGEVQEDTFYQCVQNYQQRLSALNKIGQTRLLQTEKLKYKYERVLQDQVAYLQQQIKNIQSHSVSTSSQKVINSQMQDLMHFQQGMRVPLKNLFVQQKAKKRLISRK